MTTNLHRRLAQLEQGEQSSSWIEALETARQRAIAGLSPPPWSAPTLEELASLPSSERALWQRFIEARARAAAARQDCGAEAEGFHGP